MFKLFDICLFKIVYVINIEVNMQNPGYLSEKYSREARVYTCEL